MSFIQPWLLLALPLILIPIVIHLVNQWRYQTKPWAAMMFLLAAQSMHRGFARLRQWMILAMRVLAVTGLIFAISRPLTSGVMGLVAGGRIDTTIIMIDRSPSMLQQGTDTRESKLLTGLRQLRETLSNRPSSRWLLIDSANPSPQEFSSLDALIDSPLAEGTSTIAAWPVMFQSALEYIQTNRPSQTDIWICTDLRQGDWQVQNGPWPAIREAFQKLPSPVRFFAITYPAISSTNRSLVVDHVSLDHSADRHEVVLTLRVHRNTSANTNETVPIQLTLGGGRTEIPIELISGVGELKDYRIPIDASVTLGWGKASIPDDDNPADNEHYFVFDAAPDRKTVIFCEQPELILPLQIASEIPNNSKNSSSVQVLTLDMAAQADFEDASLVIWQGPLPQGEFADRLQNHLDRGRSVWFLPSAVMDEVDTVSSTSTSIANFRWTAWHQPTSPVHPTTWRSDDGLLASTQSGMALPVGEISVTRYATFEGDVTPLASLESGSVLLAKLNTPRGNAYVWTTLPIESHSTMAANGISLYVAIQRSIEHGSRMLGNAVNYDAVPIIPSTNNSHSTEPSTQLSSQAVSTNPLNLTPIDTWQPVATDERFLSSERGLHSGIYESGSKLVAVNRPRAEDLVETITGDQLSKLLKGLDVVRIEDSAGSSKKIQQEVWRIFLILMIVALLMEAIFSLPRKQLAPQSN